MRVAEDITDLVGQTPMLQLTRRCSTGRGRRLCQAGVSEPRRQRQGPRCAGHDSARGAEGLIAPGATIIEATAGNTGVGLALVGVNRGYKVVLFVPEGFAEEKCILMRGFGATVMRTPESEGMEGAIERRVPRWRRTPGSWGAFQFENQANPDFHHDTTAAEIWEQMEGRVDAFVAGVGTGGTFSGVARFLKKQNPGSPHRGRDQGIDPAGWSPDRIGGRHRGSLHPETFQRELADEIMVIDEDAFAMVKRLAAEEGVLAGSSAGAMVFAALEVARRLGPGKRVATVIPDSAERYLSKKIFEGGK